MEAMPTQRGVSALDTVFGTRRTLSDHVLLGRRASRIIPALQGKLLTGIS